MPYVNDQDALVHRVYATLMALHPAERRIASWRLGVQTEKRLRMITLQRSHPASYSMYWPDETPLWDGPPLLLGRPVEIVDEPADALELVAPRLTAATEGL